MSRIGGLNLNSLGVKSRIFAPVPLQVPNAETKIRLALDHHGKTPPKGSAIKK